MRRFTIALFLTALGGLAPPGANSAPYRLVCAYADEPRATVFQMSDTGELGIEENLLVGTSSKYVRMSSDGRCFAVTGGAAGTLSPYFFVDKTGAISRSLSGEEPVTYATAYDADHGFLYAYQLPYRSKTVDDRTQLVLDTGYSYDGTEGFPEFRYSASFGGLVLPDTEGYVIGVKTSSTGQFGFVTERLYFGGSSNSDLAISPDGRFAAILGIGLPRLTVVSLDPSGQFAVAQHLFSSPNPVRNALRVRYTPDGRFAIVLFWEGEFLVSLSVNPITGELTELDHAIAVPDALGGYPIDALAITPDSRYAVTLSGNFNGIEQAFLVFRIEDDGHLTRLTQTRHDWPGYVSDMDFIPPYQERVTEAENWECYE